MTTSIARPQFALIGLALLLAAACHDPIPCPDCDEQAEDEQEDGPVPDLPCGGADLMTDNLNCGTCGNECTLWYPDTEWEAGSCQAGECGPVWNLCSSEASGATCAEVCANFGISCAANGCSGLTTLLFNVGFDGVCGANSQPYQAIASACDDPIPWASPFPGGEFDTYAMCCCEES